MFKNIIFDWSGVVKDALHVHLWVINGIFKKYSVAEISVEEFKENWVQPHIRFYDKYIPGILFDEEEKIYRELITSQEAPKAKSYSGIIDLILRLKDDGRFLAVISGDSEKTILPEVKDYGLENIFEEFYPLAHDKTKALDEIIEKNNLKKEETVFIGDSNHEVEVGKQAGIKTIAVTWGFSTEERLKSLNPDYLVHNIKELEEILLK